MFASVGARTIQNKYQALPLCASLWHENRYRILLIHSQWVSGMVVEQWNLVHSIYTQCFYGSNFIPSSNFRIIWFFFGSQTWHISLDCWANNMAVCYVCVFSMRWNRLSAIRIPYQYIVIDYNSVSNSALWIAIKLPVKQRNVETIELICPTMS